MKNLKKVLSLVLALAMALSLMTVAFAKDASDFADYDDVNYQEAVDVMTAIGVFDGMNATNFAPEGNLTREQAAKIITYMIMGKEEADKLVTTVAPYADVAADRWSAGAIAWCTNEGILSGMGNNRFAPTANVTGLQFAKMLLVALGYDATIQKLTGDSWAINTATLAINADLDKGMEEVSLSADLTREQACQMAFNTMKADTVEYDSRTSIDINGAQVTIGNNKAYAVTTTKDWGENIYDETKGGTVTTAYTVQFAEQYCRDLKLVGSQADSFARPAHKWYNGSQISKNLIGTYVDDAVLVYTTAVKGTELAKDIENAGYEIKDATAITMVRNDGTENSIPYTTIDAALKSSTELGGNGVVIELYADDDDYINKIVVICTYLAKVDSVITDKASTTTIDERALNISFASGQFLSLNQITAEDDIIGFDAVYGNVEKGDYILVVPKADNSGSNAAIEISLPETVVGPLTYFKSTDEVQVAGTTYEVANTYAKGAANGGFALTSKDVTLYLDAYGYVAGYSGPSVGGDKAIVVLKSYMTLNDDGELVDMVRGVTSNGETVNWETDGAYTSYTADTMYTYSDPNNDDVYTLTAVSNTTSGRQGDTLKVVNKTIATSDKSITTGGPRVYFADDVKFIFFDDGKAVVKDGVQKVTSSDVYLTIDVGDDGLPYATAVYVDAPASASTTSSDELVFVKADSQGSVQVTVDGKDKVFTVYDAYVNGEKLDLFYTDDAVIEGYYSIEKDDASNAYILDGNRYTATTGDLAVTGKLDVVRFAGNVMTSGAGDFDLGSAVIVDTTSNGLEISSLGELKNEVTHNTIDMYVVYDADTHVASYVYLVAYTPAP